jgi:hypothetical protein
VRRRGDYEDAAASGSALRGSRRAMGELRAARRLQGCGGEAAPRVFGLLIDLPSTALEDFQRRQHILRLE